MSAAPRRAVFLDRDGVLNEAPVRDGMPSSPAGLADLVIPADVPSALEALKAAGLVLVGVTNQPDVARGRQRQDVVEAINRALLAALPLDDILVCYHDDDDGCDCRKPQPGLLLRAASAHAVDRAASFMVGDRWRDVEAGRRAGCATILIDHGYAERRTADSRPDHRVASLGDAAEWILTSMGRLKGAP